MNENARATAFELLYNIEKNREYSNIGVDRTLSGSSLSARDRALVKRLVSGVCERRVTLDYVVRSNLHDPKARLKPNVRTVLRMGAYEILYCDGIPARASVNEYVGLVKGCGAGYASGLVNAVLRRTAERGLVLPEPTDPRYDSVRYAMPPATVAYLKEALGDRFPTFADASLEKAKIYGRVNTKKTDFPSLRAVLSDEGVDIAACDAADGAFYFVDTAAFMRTSAFSDGLFHIQDLSSQLCCLAVGAGEGMRILDVCAAPGGKTLTLAQQVKDTGLVVACDIHPHKLGLIRQGAERLGLTNIQTLLRDAAGSPLDGAFDRVLCDVPCSGYGVLRKKPEIREKDVGRMRELPALQGRILAVSAQNIKPGGRLIYSTCTVIPSENDGVVADFLARFPSFVPTDVLPPSLGEKTAYGRQFFPDTDDCDGFYVSVMERIGD